MQILRALEGIRTPLFDSVFSLITRLGEETIAIIILCLIFWCINKNAAYKIGVAFFLSGLSVQGMKVCFRINRPWIVDPSFKPVQSAIAAATGYSFPSGHTQTATALYGSLGIQIKQKSVKIICFLLFILVAFSRMYLGVHTFLDVIVSLIISLIFVLIADRLLKSDAEGNKRELILPALLVLLTILVIVIAGVLYSSGIIEQVYMTDCLKAAGAGLGFAVGMYVERVYICFSVKTKNIVFQALKAVIGLAVVIAIKEGLKLVIGTGFVADTARYFLMIIWVVVLYPLIIKRFFEMK